MSKYPYKINSQWALVLIVTTLLATSTGFGQEPYPDTIVDLKALYAGEINALHSYSAYAEKARSEGLPEIAALFDALSKSESIHARNFRMLLEKMGESPLDARPTLNVHSTRENLQYAAEVELAEIDKIYPAAIERMQAEKHADAMAYTSYAWKSEKQHRELIKEIRSGTGLFFSLLKKEFEENPNNYFICQRCGSTLTEMPETTCPVCGSPASSYEQLPKKK